jgi:D-alanyl-D-alanine carboxypeptidase/D-alanyl-D-alanine-endopeptidase (penicillin-binding protein 4)
MVSWLADKKRMRALSIRQSYAELILRGTCGEQTCGEQTCGEQTCSQQIKPIEFRSRPTAHAGSSIAGQRRRCGHRRARLVVCGFLGWLASGAMPGILRADSLGDSLDHILADPVLKGGISGVLVERVDNGSVLYAHDADTRLMPASNRKLFTSAAALQLLGPGFTFTTKALSEASPDASGLLHGNLYLRGVGDSLLSPGDLDEIARAVAKAGVKQIAGRVVGDGTIFRDGPYGEGWEWDDLPYYYAMQISGLEVSHGVLAVHVTAGAAEGAPVHVAVDQPTEYLPIICTAKTAGATVGKNTPVDACVIERPRGQNLVRVSGTLPLGGHADCVVTVEDPALYAATVLTETLQHQKIAVSQAAVTGAAPDSATKLLGMHTSVPMSEYIKRMNKPSDNLLAESLVRVIGAVKGTGGSYSSGYSAETAFFLTLGLDVKGSIDLHDGCGLSRMNLVTPRAIVGLLRAMHDKPNWTAYNDSLPIAGVDGDLRNRMKGTRAAGNIHAKTGTLHGVASLSGYVTGKHGDLFVFSLILNNFPGSAEEARVVQDRFAVCLAEGL